MIHTLMPTREAHTFMAPLCRREDGAVLITGFLTVIATASLGWFAWHLIEDPTWAILAVWAIIAVVPFALRMLVATLFAEGENPPLGFE